MACSVPCEGEGLDAGMANALAFIYSAQGADPQLGDIDHNNMVDIAQAQLLDMILGNPGLATH